MKAREDYDDFYEQVLRVKNIMIENFAHHAQALLVSYIRDALKQPRAAEWFETWWTGDSVSPQEVQQAQGYRRPSQSTHLEGDCQG